MKVDQLALASSPSPRPRHVTVHICTEYLSFMGWAASIIMPSHDNIFLLFIIGCDRCSLRLMSTRYPGTVLERIYAKHRFYGIPVFIQTVRFAQCKPDKNGCSRELTIFYMNLQMSCLIIPNSRPNTSPNCHDRVQSYSG